MKISPKQLIIFGGVILAIVIFVLIYSFGARPAAPPQIILTVWGVADSAQDFEGALAAYHAVRPNVEVKYTKFDPANYDQALLEALAAGNGPDAFMIGNRSLPRSIAKIVPVSPTQLGLSEFRELFPRAPEDDFITSDGKIYALPLYLDTLALFYNKDLFDQAGIASPPKTWEDFQTIIPQLQSVDATGQITKAAAAIGGSEKTVHAAADLVELLMMQNGAQMVSPDRTQAAFSDNRGLRAFNFYLQFSNPASPSYAWNEGQENDLDSFASGKTAMIFGYQSDIAAIRQKNPFLSFAVAPIPQPSGTALSQSFPKYVGFAVSKQSKNAGWAWDFIVYFTTNLQPEKLYLTATGRPPALRSVIQEYSADPKVGVFAKQALTARTWYEADDQKIGEVMNAAIVAVLTGRNDAARALAQAADQVSQLMK